MIFGIANDELQLELPTPTTETRRDGLS